MSIGGDGSLRGSAASVAAEPLVHVTFSKGCCYGGGTGDAFAALSWGCVWLGR